MVSSILRGGGTIIAAIALFAAILPTQLAAQQITLLHISDTHSHVVAWGPKDANLDGTLGGLSKVATIVAAQKAADPNLLFVHAGDFMDGDLFFNEYHGVPELKLLQSLGLDAIALGNHEFAYGPNFLAGVLAAAWPGGAADVPVLGTNVANCAAIAAWNAGTLIKQVNGVKVGFFGLTIPVAALAKPLPCVLQPITTTAQAAVNALQAQGAQVIVALSHAGMVQARLVASSVPGIHVIVNGHDNALLEQPETVSWPGGGGATMIVSAGSRYEWIGRLRVAVSGSNVSLVDYELIPVDAAVPPEPSMQAAIDALKADIVAHYGDVYHDALAWAAKDIAPLWDEGHAKRDTPLGNLFTDAYRAWTGTDVAIEALGFLEDALPRGWIVGADVFRSMPYGPVTVNNQLTPQPWRLMTLRATGASLVSALNRTIGAGGSSFPQVSGIRLDYDSRLAQSNQFSQVLTCTVRIGEEPVVADKLYSVTVTEGVYAALSRLIPVQDVTTLPAFAFTASRNFVEARGELGAVSSNRIRDVAQIGNSGKTKDCAP